MPANVVEATVEISAKTAQFRRDTSRAFSQLRARLRGVKADFRALALGAGLFAGAVTLMGKSVIDAAVQLERMKAGLTAIMESAQEAEEHFKELEQVAKLPGLGLPEAIQGSIRLQSVAMSAEEATKTLTAVGKAIARVGGGRVELQRVVEQLSQMAAKGQVVAEDFRPIVSIMPDIIKAMDDAFGTQSIEQIREMGITASDFIAGITTELAKLPGVGNTAANAIENFHDEVFRARAALGSALLPTFTQILSVLSTTIEKFNDLSNTQKSMIAWTGAISGGLAGIIAAVTGLGLALPSLIAGIKALGVALAFLAANPIIATIIAAGLLGVAIWALRKKFEDAQITSEKFSEAMMRLSKESQKATRISKLAAQIESLKSKTSLTTKELHALSVVQKELIELAPRLVTGYDNEGNAILSTKNAVIEYSAELRTQIELEKELVQLRARRQLPELEKQIGKQKQTLQRITEELRRTPMGEPVKTESFLGQLMGSILPGERKFFGKKWIGYDRFLRIVDEQNEKLGNLIRERDTLSAGLEKVSMAKGLRVKLPPKPKVELPEWKPEDYAKQIKEIGDVIQKEADKILREPLLKEPLKMFVEVEDEALERTAKFNEEMRKNYEKTLEKIKVADTQTTEAFNLERNKRIRLFVEYNQKLISENVIRQKKEIGIAQEATEEFNRQRNEQIKQFVEYNQKLMADTTKRETAIQRIESKAYQTRLRDLSIFSKEAIEQSDKQLDAFIAATQKATSVQKVIPELLPKIVWEALIPEREFENIVQSLLKQAEVWRKIAEATKDAALAQEFYEQSVRNMRQATELIFASLRREIIDLTQALTTAFSQVFSRIVDDGKEAMSELEFAVQGFTQAFAGDYAGLVGTVTTYFGGLIDMVRGIDKDFVNAIEGWEESISDSVADVISRGILDGLSEVDIEEGIREFIGKALIARAISILVADLPQMQEAITEWATALEEALGEFSEAGRQISRTEQARISEAAQRISISAGEIAKATVPLAQQVGIIEKPPTPGRRRRRGVIVEEEVLRRPVEIGEERQIGAKKGQAGPAVQISAITGPTRDLLISLLTPLRNLNILPALFNQLTRAINEMRNAFLGNVSNAALPMAEDGTRDDNITIENVNINVKKAADVGDIEQLDRNLSRAVRREKRLLGRRA